MIHPTGNLILEKALEIEIKNKERQINILNESKIDVIKRSPSPKRKYIPGSGFIDLNMEDMKSSEREINYLQNIIDQTHSEIKNLRDRLIIIKNSPYISSNTNLSLQNKLDLEKIKAQQIIEKKKLKVKDNLLLYTLKRK